MYNQRGSVLLSVSIIIFLLSAAAAGGVWYLEQRGYEPAVTEEPTPTPDNPIGNALNPTVLIHEELQTEETTLQTNLVAPLRQYYATREEYPTKITVAPVDHESFIARVELTMNSADQAPRTLSFLYDLSPWTPSMLDNNAQ